MFQIFARPKPCRIMVLLREPESVWHLSKLAKGSDTTYVYVTRLMGVLAKKGIIVIEPKGKKRIVRLTEKGVRIANAIFELRNMMED
jgi:predicted transcriptional regulator